MLDPSEHAQASRFMRPRDATEYRAAHALVRTVLSRHAAVPPGAWTFRRNAWGRPEVATPALAPGLRFNLSHTAGLVACAVVPGRAVGIDVEARARVTTSDIADQFFATEEAAALARVEPAERSDRFLAYWTLKEAYIKARGMGLAIALDSFWFEMTGPEPLFHTASDDPARWQFARGAPTVDHVLAACVERVPGQLPLEVVVREADWLAMSPRL